MMASELIKQLQDIIESSESNDVEVSVEDIKADRYGWHIGLKAGNKVLVKGYIGGGLPLW